MLSATFKTSRRIIPCMNRLMSGFVNQNIIKPPTNHVIREAVKADPHIVRFFPNIDLGILKIAVHDDPNVLQYVENPSDELFDAIGDYSRVPHTSQLYDTISRRKGIIDGVPDSYVI